MLLESAPRQRYFQVPPADTQLSLVDPIGSVGASQIGLAPLVNLWRIALHPPVDGFELTLFVRAIGVRGDDRLQV